MKITTETNLSNTQKKEIVRLWNAEYPIQLSFAEIADFDKFLDSVTERFHFLLNDENEALKGWLMSFTRDGGRWFSVIIDGKEKKKGYGSMLLEEVKKREDELNGWAVESSDYLKGDGEKYQSPIEFYKKKGFQIFPDVKMEKENFYAVKINWKREI